MIQLTVPLGKKKTLAVLRPSARTWATKSEPKHGAEFFNERPWHPNIDATI
jgi:hypothetical protein